MKKTGIVLLSLLLCLLLCGTAAADRMESPKGAAWKEIDLSAASTVGEIIDWLDSYRNTDMSYALNLATDLAGYCLDIDENASALAMSAGEDSQVSEWYAVYFGLRENAADPSPKKVVTDRYRDLAETDARLGYYMVHLQDLLTRYLSLRDQVLSGEYGQDEMVFMKDKMDLLKTEAEETCGEAVQYVLGNVSGAAGTGSLTKRVGDSFDQLNALNFKSQYAAQMQAVQGLGSLLAAAEANRVKAGEGTPTINVISKKQFGFTFTDQDHKIDSLEVTVTCEQDPKLSKTVTSVGGQVTFELSYFKADANRKVSVFVSWKDPTGQYQNKNLGRMEIIGGQIFHMTPARNDGKTPYVVGLLFEDQDMTVLNGGMVLGQHDDRDYNVNVEIEPNGQTGTFRLSYPLVELGDGNTGAKVLIDHSFGPGNSKFSVKSKWLNNNDSNTAPHFYSTEEAPLQVELICPATRGQLQGNPFHVGPNFRFKASDWKDAFSLDQATDDQLAIGLLGNAGIKLPANLPVIGGAELTFPKPLMKTYAKGLERWKLQINPNGTIELAFNLTLLDKDDDDSGRIYAGNNLKTLEARLENDQERATSLRSLWKNGIKEAKATKDVKSYGSIGVDATWLFAGIGHISLKDNKVGNTDFDISLDVQTAVMVSITGSFTVATPVPFVNLNLSLTASARVDLGVGAQITVKSGKFGISVTKPSGIKVTLGLVFDASLGVGITGMQFRVGFQASAEARFPLTVGGNGPEFEISLMAYIKVELLFVFSWQGNVFVAKWPKSSEVTDDLRGLSNQSYFKQTHYLQTDDSVFVFWVEDQGTNPKLLMDEVGVPDEPRVLFDMAKEKNWYPYIYDFDVAIGNTNSDNTATGIAYAVSVGDWDGLIHPDPADTRTLEDRIIDGLAVHPNGKTYIRKFWTDHSVKDAEVIKDYPTINLKMAADPIPNQYTWERFNETWFLGTHIDPKTKNMGVYVQAFLLDNVEIYHVETVSKDSRKYHLPTYEITIKRKDMNKDKENDHDYYAFILYNPKGNGLSSFGEVSVSGTSLRAWFSDLFEKGNYSLAEPITMVEHYTNAEYYVQKCGVTRANTVDKKDGTGAVIGRETSIEHFVTDTISEARFQKIDLPYNSTGYRTMTFHDGSNNYRQYLWWLEAYTDKEGDKEIQKQRIRASMVDPTNNSFSPSFIMIDNLDGETDYDGLYYSRKIGSLVVTYSDDWSRNLIVKTLSVPTIDSFTPEYPALAQGERFNMYFRLKNNSHVILETANISMTAQHVGPIREGEPQTVQFTSRNINLRDPQKSSVTHYNYMIEDGLVGLDATGAEMDALLATLDRGERDPYVETGAHTAVRIEDYEEDRNTNYVRRMLFDAEGNITGQKTEPVKYFMPGSVGTFLVPADPKDAEQLKKWVGTYTLMATVDRYTFSLSPEEGAQRYLAVLNDGLRSGRSAGDSYTFYLLDENGEPTVMNDAEQQKLLDQFEILPPVVSRDYDETTDLAMNTQRRDTLKTANRAYAMMEHNDYALDARLYHADGKDLVEVQLENEAADVAPDMTPKLIAQVQYLDEVWRNTGWSKTLTGMDLSSGFNRTLEIPFEEITNGKKYERVRVGVVSAGSDDPKSFYDMNSYNNFEELYPKGNFVFVKQPQDLECEEGQDAVFECEVQGVYGPYTYQWVVYYPNGSYHTVTGEDLKEGGSAYTLTKASLDETDLIFRCIVTDARGFSFMSDKALLTVKKGVPKTGDTFRPELFGLLALAALAGVVTAVRKRHPA